MIDEEKLDLGSIQVHKKVLADITALTVSKVDGASLVSPDLVSRFFELIGQQRYPGITVTMDKNHQITIEVKVFVRYGMNISDVARQIQDSVRAAIERTVDVNLKDINVNIEGIERGE